MSDNEVIVGLVTIVVFGVGAQWIARRLAFPSLLLLLPAGLLAGDVLGLVDPVGLFGDTLFPGATLLVALLLFQSGLQLRVSDLPRTARGPVLRLVGIGGTLTFLGATLAVLWIVDVTANLAFLVGAIIVVSGPTVVGPLLQVVRPRAPTGSILNWEGTALDPVGATLGVVVLNLVLASDRGGLHPVWQMSARLALGVAAGLVAAGLLVFVMSRFLLTDNMEAAVALLFATLAFGVSEVVLSEAGLFATVVMGFAAANQRVVPTARITGFGETLEVLIIGTLFIVLGGLVQVDALADHAWQIVALVVALVVIVRPVSVAISLIRTKLSWRDRAVIGSVDPRGIVAASTAAQFSVTLSASGLESDFILPVVFGVILGTGVAYGLGAAPLARRLRVALPPPTGVGLVGDAAWLTDLGRCLQECGVTVLRAISAPPGHDASADAELPTISLADSEDQIIDAVGEAEVSQVLIASKPGPVLTIATAVFVERLGRRHVLRLPVSHDTGFESRLATGAGPHPFAPGVTLSDIEERIGAGAKVRRVDDTSVGDILPLAAVGADGTVNLRVADKATRPGDVVIALVGPHPNAGDR